MQPHVYGLPQKVLVLFSYIGFGMSMKLSGPNPLHPTALRLWQPLSDDEWAAIQPYLPPHSGRGRPSDKRKTLNAVFWIACSREPWRALPSHLGNGESVAKTLRRWARAGWLDRLLVLVSDHPLSSDDPALRKLGWLICRAFRRMARIVGDDSVKLAERLGLFDAWPAPVLRWPDNAFAAVVNGIFVSAGRGVCAMPLDPQRIRRTLRVYDLCRPLMRFACGNRHAWRLR